MQYSYGICCENIVDIEKVKIPENIENKVYEVMRIIDGKVLYFEEHMDRMEASIQFYDPGFIIDREKIIQLIRDLLNHTKASNNNIRIEGYLDNDKCHLIGFIVEGIYPDAKMYENGVHVKTLEYERKDPSVKYINHDYKEFVSGFIEKEKIYEALLFHEGKITEGSRSNVFFIKGNEVYSADSSEVLSGITRAKLAETLMNMGIDIIEKDISKKDINSYDAAFLTGTSIHVLPINKIDDMKYDIENKLLRKIMKAFEQTVLNYLTI